MPFSLIAPSLLPPLETFELLKLGYKHIFYVNGNNELRLSNKDPHNYEGFELLTTLAPPLSLLSCADSVDKFFKILDICKEFGIETNPRLIGGCVYIVPLFSWYSPTFDKNFNNDFSFEVDPLPLPLLNRLIILTCYIF